MDFRGIDAKIDRARSQIMALSADIDGFCANSRKAIVHEVDTDAGEQKWIYRDAAPEAPIEWSIRVGEILSTICDLRLIILYATRPRQRKRTNEN